jgi:DNA-binding MarR family transcriptional regulator
VILAVLSGHPAGRMSAQEPSASLEWEKSRLSHQVRRVEHLGLIARERHPFTPAAS